MNINLMYDMMNGSLIGDAIMFPKENIIVTSEFEDGMYCSEEYDKAYNAKIRIEDRLISDEDKDTEAIVNNMNDIIRYLCKKSYDCGKNSNAKRVMVCEREGNVYLLERFQKIMGAKRNLESRLNKKSDTDVEIMMEGMLNIMKHLMLKAYEYGEKASKQDRSM